VNEDPVTGTASGAAGAYLDHFDAFDDDTPAEMVFEQGHFVDRPGTVRVRVGAGEGGNGGAGDAPAVGGTAVETLDGRLRVPAAEADDILEA
jgi:trans-2,3-dihydro-3-hydroxyanthranilate isomerase